MIKQAVNSKDQFNASRNYCFNMIDNYIYLYHTKTLIAIPTFPEQLQDAMSATFNPTTILGLSAPIQTYANSGPRTFSVTLDLHRDMMTEINTDVSNLKLDDLSREDYVDILATQIQAAALPRYAASEKMVDPPLVAVRFGDEIFCKGVVNGGVSVTYSGPILSTNKYAHVTIDFTLTEVDPYDAETVLKVGGFRGFSTDLERNLWTKRGNR